MKTITIDGEQVQVSTQPSNARRSIDIEFKPGEIIVRIPRGQKVDLETILTRKRDVITRKYREAASRIRLLNGDTIHIKGQPYKIETHETPSPPEPRVKIEGKTLTVNVKDKEDPNIILKKWITEQTKQLIHETLQRHKEKLEATPEKTRIQDTARWGYCSKRGEIVYNWQLATLPPELAEYVVVHEAVHLQHLNHQRRFHRKLQQIIQDHRRREKQLQRYRAIPTNFQHRRQNKPTNPHQKTRQQTKNTPPGTEK